MAPPSAPPTTITLRVKIPPGSIAGGADEFCLGTTVPVAARVGQVRERIQQAVPSQPAPERQRLLYGGRALVDNEQTLADALNIKRDPSQQEYVIHLLIKADGTGTTPSPHRPAMGSLSRSGSPAPAPPDAHEPRPPQQQPPHLHNHMPHPQPNAAPHPAVLPPQQGLHPQMQWNAANMNRFQPGLLPFGMQPMHFGPHIPAHYPQHPVPAAFPRGAGQGQHNHPPHAPNTPARDSTQAGNVQETAEEPQERPGPHNPPMRPVSNQGFHMEGIGPNGERVMVHQQTVSISHGVFPGAPHVHMPHNPQLHAFHGNPPGISPQPHIRRQRPPTLDRARDNFAEARRRLDALRTAFREGAEPMIVASNLAEIVEHIEHAVRALSDYIDTFQLGDVGGSGTGTPSPQLQALRHQQQQGTGSDVTCYLLSSPTGPQAILYSPQHGTFQGPSSVPSGPSTAPDRQPTPTTAVVTSGDGTPPEQHGPNQAAVAQQVPAPAPAPAPAQVQAAQQDPLGPLAPVMNHLWLLLRILIFSYFLLGANLGWRRPLALMAIGLGFWMIRMGLLAEGAALRRWWDGIMNENQRRPRGRRRRAERPAGDPGQQQRDGPPPLRPGQMPTPEQVAQRLLDEDARVRNDRLQRVREYLRPVERAAALLVASLWPGVGEAYVRAREREDRRRAEEEVAAARREEEERQREEEEQQKKKAEEGSAPDAGAGAGTGTGTDPDPDSTSAGDGGTSAEATAAPVESTS